MGALYLTWLADELRSVGLAVVEYDGWQTRSRSSGGFDAAPLAVFWHHTASDTSAQNDCDYMCNGSPDKPIANLYVAQDGTVWVLAAGATNTNGKGAAMVFSRGTVPNDGANTRVVGVEMANDGVGETWPAAQLAAAFTLSNAINARVGNQPDDVATHHSWAEDRKIDPATAAAVDGAWQPQSVSSSGSWSLNDLRDECFARATSVPPNPTPIPPPKDDDDMSTFLLRNRDTGQIVLLAYDGAGVTATGMAGDDLDAYVTRFGAWLDTDPAVFDDLIAKSNE